MCSLSWPICDQISCFQNLLFGYQRSSKITKNVRHVSIFKTYSGCLRLVLFFSFCHHFSSAAQWFLPVWALSAILSHMWENPCEPGSLAKKNNIYIYIFIYLYAWLKGFSWNNTAFFLQDITPLNKKEVSLKSLQLKSICRKHEKTYFIYLDMYIHINIYMIDKKMFSLK